MNNTSTKRKKLQFFPLRLLFVICFLGSISGFPWAFVPQEQLLQLINTEGKIMMDNSLTTLFVFKLQCLFFGAFSGVYLLMAINPLRYKYLILWSSLLMIVMSGAMVYVRNSSGLYTPLTAVEHYYWFAIGVLMLLLWNVQLKRLNSQTFTGTHKLSSTFTLFLYGLSLLFLLMVFVAFLPMGTIERGAMILELSPDVRNPYALYAIKLCSFLFGILGLIIGLISTNLYRYKTLLRFIFTYAIFVGGCWIWWLSIFGCKQYVPWSISVGTILCSIYVLLVLHCSNLPK